MQRPRGSSSQLLSSLMRKVADPNLGCFHRSKPPRPTKKKPRRFLERIGSSRLQKKKNRSSLACRMETARSWRRESHTELPPSASDDERSRQEGAHLYVGQMQLQGSEWRSRGIGRVRHQHTPFVWIQKVLYARRSRDEDDPGQRTCCRLGIGGLALIFCVWIKQLDQRSRVQ